MKFVKFFFGLVILLLISGCAFTSNEVSTQEARAIYFVPKSVSPSEVKNALKAAISGRVNNIKVICKLMPETLPAKPGHPINKNIFGGLAVIGSGNPEMEAMQINTLNAYCTLQGSETYGSMFNKNEVVYKAAIYPYKDGYKVYIYEIFQEGSNGIMGHLIQMSVAKLMGSNSPFLFMAQVMDKFERELPQAKLINITPKKIEEIKNKLASYQKEL
jgi:hypothetical protein